MNKKLFLGMFAAAGMLFATSCSHEDLIEPVSGETSTVSFTVSTEDAVATRAIADGSTATKLHYAVWHSSGSIAKQDVVELQNGSTTLSLTLAKGQEYKLGFWAQASDSHDVTIAEDGVMTVSVNYGDNNAESFDAFTAHKTYTVAGNDIQTVTLKRPFAQINVGVTEANYTAAKTAGVEVTKSEVELQGVFGTQFNVLTGEVIASQSGLTLGEAAIPSLTGETLTVDGRAYKYISTSYVLPEKIGESQLVDAKFTFKGTNGNEVVLDNGVSNLPIKSNYRTNILGNVLTGNVDFEVVVDPAFDGENNTALWDGSSVSSSFTTDEEGRLHIKSAEDFALLMSSTRNANSAYTGKTFVLDTDIDFAGQTITGVGSESCNFAATFDGNGHTISNFVIDQSGRTFYGGLFCQMTTTNATVKNLTVKGATVIANKMAGVIASSVEGGAAVENCHVENCVVVAKVKKAGAIAGYTSGGTVKNCSAKDVQVYCADPTEAAEIVGYENTGSTVADNTAENVTVSRGTVTIATAAELAAVANGGYVAATVKYVLVSDIDLNGQTIAGFGGPNATFNGQFDGNDHTIKNFVIDNSSATEFYTGMFNQLHSGAVIKNLTVEGATVIGQSMVGVIASNSENGSVIDNCHVKNSTVISTVKKAGAVVGYASNGTVTNCTAENVAVYCADPVQAGEIVGYENAGSTVTGNVPTNVTVVRNALFVSSAEQFATLGEYNGTIYGVVTNKNIVLTKDLDLAGVALTPIRLDNSVFDGNGHKLTNVTVGEYGGRKSLFNGEVLNGRNSTVKNLTIDGVTVDGGLYGGVIFGDIQNGAAFIIDGVHIKNAVVKNAETVGAFIGFIGATGTNDVTIKNSSVENATVIGTEEAAKIGAIVGRAQRDWTLDNVVAKNVVLYNNSTLFGDVRAQGTKSAGTCNGTLTVE